MTDTHTHIYLPEFDADRSRVIASAREAGVSECWLPAIDASSLEPMRRLSEAYPGYFRLFAGLHPTEIAEDWPAQLDALQEFVLSDDCAGIGEIGMDLYWDASWRSLQEEVLARQLDWAVETGKPVLLHVRNAFDEILPLVRSYYGKGLRGIFHCFSGTLPQAQEVISHGFLIGVNGSITYRSNPVRSFLSQVPLEYVVTETDAPYLPPVPYRGQRNEPAWVVRVIACLSEVYGVSEEEVADVVVKNANFLLKKSTQKELPY